MAEGYLTPALLGIYTEILPRFCRFLYIGPVNFLRR